MKGLVRKAIDIREEEIARTGIMFGYIFLIIASYLILKPMTRSLFLKNLGPAQLPLVYILVALVVGVVAVLYAKLSAAGRRAARALPHRIHAGAGSRRAT